MKVLAWPGDDGGCGHYRITWPAEALIMQGADVELVRSDAYAPADVTLLDETVDGVTYPRAIGLGPVDADVVVIQRPLAAHRADLVSLLQAQGIAVVVEIDDDFETIHPRNVSFRSTHPKWSPGWNRKHLARACREADLIVCTTSMLAHRYARHGRVAVVPNHVPAWYLDVDQSTVPERTIGERARSLGVGSPKPAIPPATEGSNPSGELVSVGWTGTIDTHPTDLQVARGAVAKACRDSGAPFEVVGTGRGVQAALALDEPPAATGWLSLDLYPTSMARHGVGIVPLDDILFNEAKSALKLMEYAALGVPVVASPNADNARMHSEGIGLLAAKPKHWHAHLRALLADEEYRADLAGQGRAAMERWTIEGNTDRWWDAWTTCHDRKVAA